MRAHDFLVQRETGAALNSFHPSPARLTPTETIPTEPGKLVLFFSDAHVHPHHPERGQRVETLLEMYRGRVSALICLGDLFDVWLGYDSVVPTYALGIYELLQHYWKENVPYFHFKGNHDFVLGAPFEDVPMVTSFAGPQGFFLDGMPVVLSHGDECDGNLGYRAIRRIFFSRWFHAAIQSIPVDRAQRLGLGVRKSTKEARREWKPAPRLQYGRDRFLRACVEAGADVVISGHQHRPQKRTFLWNDRTLLAIDNGDLVEHDTYTVYAPGEGFRLCSLSDLPRK